MSLLTQTPCIALLRLEGTLWLLISENLNTAVVSGDTAGRGTAYLSYGTDQASRCLCPLS